MRIVNGSVFVEDRLRRGVSVAFEADSITALGARLPASETYDAAGCYVVPGFIDTHVHGFAGRGVMEGEAAVRHMARRLACHGTTAFLPTLTSAPLEAMAEAARGSARAFRHPTPGAAVVGLHLEGPFLNPKRKGAADERFLRAPSLSDFEAIAGPYASLVRMVAMAPELPGGLGLVDALVARGIRVACGHSDATYEQAMEAVAHGASVATHTFNAMSPLHHRSPGMAGAALTCPQLYAEFIADFVHLHPAAVRLTLAGKGRDGAIAITDCMKYGGLTEAEQASMPGDRTVRGGAPRLADGTLAGSCLTLDQSLRNLVHGLGVPLEDALPAYTANPSRLLGLTRRGSLAAGHYADLVVLDATLRVRAVWAAGRRML